LSGSKQANGVGPAIVNHADSPSLFMTSSTWSGSSIVVTLQSDLIKNTVQIFSFNLTNDHRSQNATTSVSIASDLASLATFGRFVFSEANGIMQIMQAKWTTASAQQSLPYRTSPHAHP
jgi:hypothetical protein